MAAEIGVEHEPAAFEVFLDYRLPGIAAGAPELARVFPIVRLRRRPGRSRRGLRIFAGEEFDGGGEIDLKRVLDEAYNVRASRAAPTDPGAFSEVDGEPVTAPTPKARAGPLGCAHPLEAGAEPLCLR